jgi:hypothetical protein
MMAMIMMIMIFAATHHTVISTNDRPNVELAAPVFSSCIFFTNLHDFIRLIPLKKCMKNHSFSLITHFLVPYEQDQFDPDEEREVAMLDWSEDCERYKLKVTDCLSKSQYYSSM